VNPATKKKPAQKLSSISAFFPAYNDGGTIPSMIVMAHLTIRQMTDDFEIIVVNDGSSDHTSQVLNEIAQLYPELRVIHHPKNKGYGGALKTGFEAATKEWIFYTDGDAQYNPMDLHLLVDTLDDGIDVVNGYKISRNDPLIRIVLGNIYNGLVKFAFGIHLRDIDCDFRLMRRSIFDTLRLESNSGAICVEMVKKMQNAGYRFAEAPVHHYHRQYGVSQFFNWRRLLRVTRSLSILWWKLVVARGS
jgi:glycosyltransferase involved in cell wall biosynthesis